MKTIEITDEIYEKVMEDSKDGMPFEPCLWKIVKDRNDYKKMNKEMMTIMLGAVLKIPESEMMRKLKEFDI